MRINLNKLGKNTEKIYQRVSRLILIIGTLILSSCNMSEESTTTSSATNSSSGADLSMRWNASALPLKINVSSDFDLSEKDGSGYNLIQQMQEHWNNADSSQTFFDLSTEYTVANKDYGDLNSYLDSELGVYQADTWFDFIGDGVLAITSYLGENRGSYIEMIHADIIVNNENFSFTNNTSDTTSAYDLPSVIIHELGHLLGLKHVSDPDVPSVMQSTLGRHDVRRNATAYDSTYITSLYDLSFALTASSSNALAITASEGPKYIHGYMELRADGTCNHFRDGNLIESHKVKLKK